MRRMPIVASCFAAPLLLAWTAPLLAHHSFAATYNAAEQIEVQGTVKELVWRNPHSFIRIDVVDENGKTQTWALEWGSINQLSDAQLTRTTLKPGDVVIAKGDPARDSQNPRLLVRSIKRPSDGWEWVGRVR